MKFLAKTRIVPLAAFVGAVLILALLWNFAGCSRKSKGAPPPAPPEKRVDFGNDSTNVAQLAEPVEATVVLYRAGAVAPERARVLLPAGTWLVPTSVYAGAALEREKSDCGEKFCPAPPRGK